MPLLAPVTTATGCISPPYVSPWLHSPTRWPWPVDECCHGLLLNSASGSSWIGRGPGGIAAAARGDPHHRSRLGLGELPAAGLLGAMVAAAERGQVALTRPAALVIRQRVV